MKTVLAIDTASADFALAIAQDARIAASLTRDGRHDHSRLLLAAIAELLGDYRRDLAGIVAVRGPGSYAGIRVGLATAQGLALAASVPIRGISTMEAIAAASGHSDVTAIHPAGRGELAVQEFRGGHPTGPIVAKLPAEIAGTNIAGEGASVLGGMEISPEERCRAALRRMLPALSGDAGASVEAIYLREPNITTPRRHQVPAR